MVVVVVVVFIKKTNSQIIRFSGITSTQTPQIKYFSFISDPFGNARDILSYSPMQPRLALACFAIPWVQKLDCVCVNQGQDTTV